MIAILRAWALAFVVLTVFYWLLRIYFRSTRREALEKRFDAEGREGTVTPGLRRRWQAMAGACI